VTQLIRFLSANSTSNRLPNAATTKPLSMYFFYLN
jgi:hypothetical protein